MSLSLRALSDQYSARERSVRYRRMSPDLRDESVLIRIVTDRCLTEMKVFPTTGSRK